MPSSNVRKLAPVGRIGLGVVLLDEAARAAHHVQAHQLAPVVGVLALLERGQRANGALMAADELGLAELAEQPLRPNADVLVLGDEQAELVRKVEVGLVVRRRREQDALALVLLDVLLDGPVALALAVAQVVALVDQDKAIAPQLRQLRGRTRDARAPSRAGDTRRRSPPTSSRGSSGR